MRSKDITPYLSTAGAIYSYLNLTEAQTRQAGAFLHREHFRNLNEYHLSYWESQDYEYYIFSGFLDDGQMQKYLAQRKKNIASHEKSLIESDKTERVLKEIEREENEIKYIEEEFIPAIRKKFVPAYLRNDITASKLDFLKSEYKNFLEERFQEIISTHFRESRHYRPNHLKSELLKHRILAMCPNFLWFRAKMDYATKAAADFLGENFTLLSLKKDKIDPIVNALCAFRKKSLDEYLEYLKSANIGFFYGSSEDKRSEKESEQHFWFSLLLLDEGYYGYK